jgi:hypothetical protein
VIAVWVEFMSPSRELKNAMTTNVRTPDEIQREMAALRGALEQEVSGVVNSARTLSDWRYHFREHPALFCAAAAAMGFALVPRSKDHELPAVSAHEGGAENQRAASVEAGTVPSRSVMAVLLGLAANAAAREATRIVTRHGRELLDRFLVARTSAKPGEPVSRPQDALWD